MNLGNLDGCPKILGDISLVRISNWVRTKFRANFYWLMKHRLLEPWLAIIQCQSSMPPLTGTMSCDSASFTSILAWKAVVRIAIACRRFQNRHKENDEHDKREMTTKAKCSGSAFPRLKNQNKSKLSLHWQRFNPMMKIRYNWLSRDILDSFIKHSLGFNKLAYRLYI